jgi:uncharacterized protein YeaO (DUF488 family)
MAIRTKRWNDPIEQNEGFRLLITRYRPRGVRKEDETWDAWEKGLGPSVGLHAAVYGKHGKTPITWDVYRQRYLKEMRDPAARAKIKALAERVRGGETITLLCSSQCVREDRCHRSLLKSLIEREVSAGT